MISRLSLDRSVFFEKRHQFLNPEVGEDMAMPIKSGCLGLAGESDHFIHRLAIAGDDDGIVVDALAVQVRSDFFAPRAGNFDVEDRSAHC